VFIKEIEL
jgi:hypothetical protein